SDADGMRRQQERLHSRYGHATEFLETEAVRARLASKKYFQGLHDAEAFHIHPLNYARALAATIEARRGRIFERSRAVAVELDGAEKIVRTEAGAVRAEHVVFTCGGYTDGLVPRLRRSQLPIATYVLITEQAPELLAERI